MKEPGLAIGEEMGGLCSVVDARCLICSTNSMSHFGCKLSSITAREAAAATYFPIVVGINLGYLFLRLVYQRASLNIYSAVVTMVLVAGSVVAYKGILEDHANAPKGKGGSEALAGGASLDLLGLLVVVQYGTVLVSEKLYWLLVIIPVWGGWKLYSIFGSKDGLSGLMPNMNPPESNEGVVDGAAAEKANEKRQKRAERRRQKWS